MERNIVKVVACQKLNVDQSQYLRNTYMWVIYDVIMSKKLLQSFV